MSGASEIKRAFEFPLSSSVETTYATSVLISSHQTTRAEPPNVLTWLSRHVLHLR